jgi:hypothetical protein
MEAAAAQRRRKTLEEEGRDLRFKQEAEAEQCRREQEERMSNRCFFKK